MIASRLRGAAPRRAAAVRQRAVAVPHDPADVPRLRPPAVRHRRRLPARLRAAAARAARRQTVQALDDRRRLLRAARSRLRAISTERAAAAIDQFREQAYRRADQPGGGPRLRPAARAGEAARPLRPAPVGPGVPAGPAAGRGGHGGRQRHRQHAGERARVHQLGRPSRQRHAARPLRRVHARAAAVLRPGGVGADRGHLRPRPGPAKSWSW